MPEIEINSKNRDSLEYYSSLIEEHKLIPNGKIKDTAFALCVKKKEYLLDFYLSIHPEDKDVTADDIELINIENLFMEDIYNDCSFVVRGKKLILIECQSLWTENIGYRLMEYYTALYPMLVPDFQTRKHWRKKLDVPDFELYVFYVGKEDVPEKLYVTSYCFPVLDKPYIPIGVFTGKNSRGKAREFFDFCETRDRNVSLYKNSVEAIEKTIFECLDRGILVSLINEKKHELEAHMTQSEKLKYAQYMKLTIEERVREKVEERVKEEIEERVKEEIEERVRKIEEKTAEARAEAMAEGIQEGRAEGRQEGRAQNREETLRIIMDSDIPLDSKNLLMAKLGY